MLKKIVITVGCILCINPVFGICFQIHVNTEDFGNFCTEDNGGNMIGGLSNAIDYFGSGNMLGDFDFIAGKNSQCNIDAWIPQPSDPSNPVCYDRIYEYLRVNYPTWPMNRGDNFSDWMQGSVPWDQYIDLWGVHADLSNIGDDCWNGDWNPDDPVLVPYFACGVLVGWHPTRLWENLDFIDVNGEETNLRTQFPNFSTYYTTDVGQLYPLRYFREHIADMAFITTMTEDGEYFRGFYDSSTYSAWVYDLDNQTIEVDNDDKGMQIWEAASQLQPIWYGTEYNHAISTTADGDIIEFNCDMVDELGLGNVESLLGLYCDEPGTGGEENTEICADGYYWLCDKNNSGSCWCESCPTYQGCFATNGGEGIGKSIESCRIENCKISSNDETGSYTEIVNCQYPY